MNVPATARSVTDPEIICDDCGELCRAWDYSPAYDRLCLECLKRAESDDYRADLGDWEYHQGADQ